MSSQDITEALMGIRRAAASTPPPDDVSSDEEETSPTIDRDLEARMSLVEDQLLKVMEQQELLVSENDPLKEIDKVKILSEEEYKNLPIHQAHAYPCADTHKMLPAPPSRWPQGPVMLRPTPLTTTKIRGIRKSNDPMTFAHFSGFCAGCILPLNNGTEKPGDSFVIDFETKHFVGTLLMRIKDAPSASSTTKKSYFDGKKRRFQAVVKGKFKTPGIRMADCVTGQTFDRPAGKLPAKWIVKSFIKFVSALAPQLEATIDGSTPQFLSPLCATAHTIEQTEAPMQMRLPSKNERAINYSIYAGADQSIESTLQEPSSDSSSSVVGLAMKNPPSNGSSSNTSRQKLRKKVFNNLAAAAKSNSLPDDTPTFDLDKEYTFEFYQHLLLFGKQFAVDMGPVIGKIPLEEALRGQPLKFMSALRLEDGTLDYLWCFDIWHEALYELAKQYS